VQQLTNLTMGQLFYILGHIQKLSAQAPVTAQALLADNPQICYALLHAECLAGMVDKPMLPMNADELRKAKLRARQIQEEIEDHELPKPAGQEHSFAFGSSAKSASVPPSSRPRFADAAHPAQMKAAGLGVKTEAGHMPGQRVKSEVPVPPLPPSFAKSSSVQASPMASAMGSQGGLQPESAEQKQVLMDKLMQLTPEQIMKLPEETKVQVLKFLRQSQSGGPPA